MSIKKFFKQPSEVIDYLFDFTEWLADRQDSIVSQTVTAAAGITLGDVSRADGIVRVFLSGGTNGTTYKVTCVITTAGGRTKEAELNIRIKEI